MFSLFPSSCFCFHFDLTMSMEQVAASLLQTFNSQNLAKNEQTAIRWINYRRDVEQAKSTIDWLPKKLSHKVMVPIGNKALMPGKLVHTNELLVNIGDTWFVKATADQTKQICDRRLQKCNDMLERLEKESQLITEKLSLPLKHEAFGSEDHPEIREHVTAKEHDEWMEVHLKKVKEYNVQLAKLRKEKKPTNAEEDLWRRLDELELEEELEDELNRLHADDSSEEEVDGDAEEDLNGLLATNNKDVLTDNVKESEPVCDAGESSNQSKRRVSFQNNSSDLEDTMRLVFSHSENPPDRVSSDPSVIISPADIYNQYVNVLKSLSPVSILKNCTNRNQAQELQAAAEADIIREELCDVERKWGQLSSEQPLRDISEVEMEMDSVQSGLVLNDIVERDTTFVQLQSDVKPQKKISKFKAARMKNK